MQSPIAYFRVTNDLLDNVLACRLNRRSRITSFLFYRVSRILFLRLRYVGTIFYLSIVRSIAISRSRVWIFHLGSGGCSSYPAPCGGGSTVDRDCIRYPGFVDSYRVRGGGPDLLWTGLLGKYLRLYFSCLPFAFRQRVFGGLST